MDRSVLRARISKKFNDIHNKFEVLFITAQTESCLMYRFNI